MFDSFEQMSWHESPKPESPAPGSAEARASRRVGIAIYSEEGAHFLQAVLDKVSRLKDCCWQRFSYWRRVVASGGSSGIAFDLDDQMERVIVSVS